MPSSHRMMRMIAIVSSMSGLLWRGIRPRGRAVESVSNGCATASRSAHIALLALFAVALSGDLPSAQAVGPTPAPEPDRSHTGKRATGAVRFFAGALIGLAAHEAGHLSLDVAFDADPRLKRVDFHGIPF